LSFFYPARSEIGASIAAGVNSDRRLRPMAAELVVLRAIAAELVGEARGLIVDVGANIGASLIELKLGAPNARFLCFEPSRRFVAALRRTVAANEWTDVRIEPYALGAAVERRTLYFNATTASVVAAAYGEREPLGAQEVEVRTLDDALERERLLDLIKIDTDGFDLDVLLGGRGVISRLRPALFFEFDPSLIEWGGRAPEALLQLLDELGYRDFLALAPGGRSPAVVARGPDELARAGVTAPHVNVLALHEARHSRETLAALTQTLGK